MGGPTVHHYAAIDRQAVTTGMTHWHAKPGSEPQCEWPAGPVSAHSVEYRATPVLTRLET
jgi:hypothetical protein